jgi:hypothetical protein
MCNEILEYGELNVFRSSASPRSLATIAQPRSTRTPRPRHSYPRGGFGIAPSTTSMRCHSYCSTHVQRLPRTLLTTICRHDLRLRIPRSRVKTLRIVYPNLLQSSVKHPMRKVTCISLLNGARGPDRR